MLRNAAKRVFLFVKRKRAVYFVNTKGELSHKGEQAKTINESDDSVIVGQYGDILTDAAKADSRSVRF